MEVGAEGIFILIVNSSNLPTQQKRRDRGRQFRREPFWEPLLNAKSGGAFNALKSLMVTAPIVCVLSAALDTRHNGLKGLTVRWDIAVQCNKCLLNCG